LPSFTDAGAIVGLPAASSFVIVPWPRLSASVALVGLTSTTENCSFSSNTLSPSTTTVIVAVVAPGANTAVPDAGW
jgi:hypothetical protein